MASAITFLSCFCSRIWNGMRRESGMSVGEQTASFRRCSSRNSKQCRRFFRSRISASLTVILVNHVLKVESWRNPERFRYALSMAS